MKTFNEWSQKEALGILPNYEHEPDSNLEGSVVNYYNDSRVRAGDSSNNEAADWRATLGHRDAMIRSANDLTNLAKELQWVVDSTEEGGRCDATDREIDVLKNIAQTIQGIADKLAQQAL